MNTLVRHMSALAVIACCSASLQAQEAKQDQSPLRINGFGTLGVTSTHAPDGWLFRRDAAQYPSDHATTLETDSRLGLQAHYEVNPQLELASQVVLKRRLPGSKPFESVEWLYAAYKPTDKVTVRLGRTNPDLFLLSDYRNVGVAYPWVRPSTDLYAALPLYTMDGADVSYAWEQSDARWRLKTFIGSGDTRATLATSPEQVIFKLRSAGGAILTREQDGLLMRATLGGARMKAQSSPAAYGARDRLRSIQNYPDPTVAQQARDLEKNWGLDTDTALFAELGVSFDRDDWIWSAEYALVQVGTGTRSAQTGYVSLGRRIGDFTVYGMLGRSVSKLQVQPTPNWSSISADAQTLATQLTYGINGSRARQSTLSLGTRWDFHPQMALKVQLDHFWVSPNGSGLWVGPSLKAARPNVLSATLDFTF